MATTRFRYRLRRDKTAAGWASENPVLFNGEPGIESDSGKFKIGNGVSAWNSLPYSGGPGLGCCCPLTNGDPVNPELIFADGDVIMVDSC